VTNEDRRQMAAESRQKWRVLTALNSDIIERMVLADIIYAAFFLK